MVNIEKVEPVEHKHWSEQLAEKVIVFGTTSGRKEPYIVSGGMTTSGPAHLGTLCEFLFPSCINTALIDMGRKTKFIFVADIMDAFDSVPVEMEPYKQALEPHLGKPLCDVPDPTGKSQSFGDYYLDETRGLMRKFGVACEILRANELYMAGRFDEYARFFLAHQAETKKIIEETSGKEERKEWSPIMPICEKCGKIATTRVINTGQINTGQTDANSYELYETYEYICDKDVKYTRGCGFSGRNKISDHKYKLLWRLHWPSWKMFFGTSIEGAGIDHHTKGGSEDTCNVIITQLFKKEHPVSFRYGFILFQGKKYSKSKGIGMSLREMVQLLPVEIIKYMLVRPDLEENIDVNPTPENVLRLIEDFEVASRLNPAQTNTNSTNDSTSSLSRADRKKSIAWNLSTHGKNGWSTPFLDVLLYYQLYKDWAKVSELTKDSTGVAYLRPYLETWNEKKFVPADYDFTYSPKPNADTQVTAFLRTLTSEMDALTVHNSVFAFAKANNVCEPKEMFKRLYLALLGKEKGPRMGKLITALGIERLKNDFGV